MQALQVKAIMRPFIIKGENLEEKHFGPVWFIPGETQGRYPNCISVYVEEAGILIDPASDRNRLIQLRENPGVKEVWLSHWHEDHIMHLDLFEDLPLVIPESESPPLSDMEILLDWYGMEESGIRALWRQLMVEQFHFRPRVPARTFEGHSVVDLGSVTMEIIHYSRPYPRSFGFFLPGTGSPFSR